MSGDIFYCDNRCVCVGVLCVGMGREGTISNQCVEAREWLNILQCITQSPPTMNYLAENVNSVAVEKPCPTAVFSGEENLFHASLNRSLSSLK